MRFVVFIAMFLSVSVIGSPVRSSLGAERNHGTASLPYDSEVEYIETASGAFIETGFIPPDSATVKWNGMVGFSPNSSNRRFVYSDGNASVAHYSEFNADNLFGSSGAYPQVQLESGTMYHATTTVSDSGYYVEIEVGDVRYTSQTRYYSSSTWGNITLFRLNGSYRGIGQRLGKTEIFVNGELIFCFIPVRFVNDNNEQEGAMYDQVSGNIFRNNGTGAFLIGPDL